MNRTFVVLVFSLAIFVAVATEAQAGKKLYVGNLPFTANGFSVVETSTTPPTPLLNVAVSLNGAHAGTIQNPGDPIPADYSIPLTNDPDRHLRDKVEAVLIYNGSAGDFPARSFFDVFTEITDPGTGQPVAMKNGTVKFFNEAKGFGFVVSTPLPDGTDQLLSFTGEINPAQTGLSFGDVRTVQPSPLDPNANSFFDIFTELSFDGAGTINPSLPLFTVTMAVPEPSGLVLAAVGMVALIGYSRRRK